MAACLQCHEVVHTPNMQTIRHAVTIHIRLQQHTMAHMASGHSLQVVHTNAVPMCDDVSSSYACAHLF